MELVGLLQSTKFRIKYDESHETPAGHCIGYLQYGVVGEVVVCSGVRDFNSAATEARIWGNAIGNAGDIRTTAHVMQVPPSHCASGFISKPFALGTVFQLLTHMEFGIWRRVVGWVGPDVSNESVAFIFNSLSWTF
jgi:hypothetical protein